MHLAAGIRTREVGNRDEVEGVVANTLNLFRHGASRLANTFGVGFIDWLDEVFTRRASKNARQIGRKDEKRRNLRLEHAWKGQERWKRCALRQKANEGSG